MATTHTPQAIEELLFKSLEEFGAPADEISREATLEDLDIDSLDMAELGQTLHDELGVNLEPKDFEQVKTVGDALSVVEARANGS